MDPQYGLTSSSINLHSAPDLGSQVIHALDPQERLMVLEEAGDMLRVQAVRLHPPVIGYALKSGVLVGGSGQQVFPGVQVKPWLTIPSVPPSVPLSTFMGWLDSGGESPWLPAEYAAAIQSGEQPSVGALIRQVIAERGPEWDAWVAEVRGQGRLAAATMDEWLVMLSGGRLMWSFRAERLFAEPSQRAAAPAWVVAQDVVRWTGHVRVNDSEPKYNLWYEIELTKLDRFFRGWYKAALLEEFTFPTAFTELANPDNAQTVFDLTRPRLHIPADPEIEDARRAGRVAAQYIEISRVIGTAAIKHNLCGELCAAALGGMDVIPALQQWLAGSKRAGPILRSDVGTSVEDLQSMLDLLGRKYEFFRAEASVAPITPGYVRKMLDSGRMAILGTGITYSGVVKWSSHIRHWIVVEDVLRVGNGAWVRIYNPFPDREEVYPFDVVFDGNAASAMGLWVEPALVPAPPAPAAG